MTWLLAALLLVWLALGPWVPVVVALALLVPRLRWWVADRVVPTRRSLGVAAAAALAVTGLVVLVPDGLLPVPAGPGLAVAPQYRGRPVAARPVRAQPPPQHPHLARNGTGTAHHDAWASDAYAWAGPVGLQPEVDTAWYGAQQCATLTFDSRGRIVAWCSGGRTLRVLDPETLRALDSKELPVPDSTEHCNRPAIFLDEEDRAVLATGDRRVLAVRTADADGEPDLTTDRAWDLAGVVGRDDCVVALMPDWTGRIWFATGLGRVGTVDPVTGKVGVRDLGETITGSFAVDESGVFLAGDTALYRLAAGPDGEPEVAWRTAYDRGSERKPGQPARGSGTTPTLLDDGLLAITDNAEPRMNVVFLERGTGRQVCRQPVFAEDAGATDGSLVSLGSAVVVANHHGYAGPLRTLLGRGTSPGLARVEVTGGRCRLAWTSTEVAPSSPPTASWATGLVYAYTKRPSWWGVSAWYLTALDTVTGRTVFSVRTGTGVLMDNHRTPVVVAPDATAYVATLGGLVRVRDRR